MDNKTIEITEIDFDRILSKIVTISSILSDKQDEQLQTISKMLVEFHKELMEKYYSREKR